MTRFDQYGEAELLRLMTPVARQDMAAYRQQWGPDFRKPGEAKAAHGEAKTARRNRFEAAERLVMSVLTDRPQTTVEIATQVLLASQQVAPPLVRLWRQGLVDRQVGKECITWMRA